MLPHGGLATRGVRSSPRSCAMACGQGNSAIASHTSSRLLRAVTTIRARNRPRIARNYRGGIPVNATNASNDGAFENRALHGVSCLGEPTLIISTVSVPRTDELNRSGTNTPRLWKVGHEKDGCWRARSPSSARTSPCLDATLGKYVLCGVEAGSKVA